MKMQIYGKVMVEESGIGIADLVVALIRIQQPSGDDVGATQRIRLGSVITGEDGGFQLNDDSIEPRADLTLEVTTPEVAGGDPCVELLHTSCDLREDAGGIESFVIEIPRARLEAAGIKVPFVSPYSDEAGPTVLLSDLGRRVTRTTEVERGLQYIATKEVDGEVAADQEREQVLAPIFASMSSVSEDQRASEKFVAEGDSVEQVYRSAMRKDLADSINTAPGRLPLSGVVALDAEQVARLSDSSGNLQGDIPADLMDTALFRRRAEDRSTVELVREDARALVSRRPTFEAASGLFSEGEEPAPSSAEKGTSQSPGVQAELSSLEDVPDAIAELLGSMTPPEQLDLDHRPTDDDVEANISQLALDSGPADVPAFYDFHHLQVAFDPVWQESMDKNTTDLVRDTYRQMNLLGGRLEGPADERGSSSEGRSLGSPSPRLSDLRIAARQTSAFYQSEPPVVVLQTFDFEPMTWQALSLQQRSTLIGLAERLANPSPNQNGWGGLFGVGHGLAEHLRLRSMGERLLRYAAMKARNGDMNGYHRMSELLRQLDQRLRTPYVFTVFAANKVERSINFGLLNTYRQRWQPITYQAGELVRTLTLAPKETRKYSHKTVIKRSSSVKEAESHASTTSQEFSETSRAEAEIIAKAETKTNFSLAAEGKFNFLLKNGTLTSSFGTDSARTSSDVKKNFREAVIKSSQEYKSERKVEVATEESMTFESTSAGEVTNPNEELTVTYLFYELQRRYRVSEKLHRVTPVVLVAQEMPEPQEIDEDWLIAHDWILQRVLLDESFRPALMALSQNVVGDEFALEEMRQHMLQQRELVETLKEGLADLRSQLGRRYSSLEGALDQRAQIVSHNDSEGIGDRAREWFYGSAGESEEAAQLREDAARDSLDRTAREERDQRGRLQQEITVLDRITSEYTSKAAAHLNRRTQITRLQVHIKQNVLYYMQAIWSHEPPDQRYFRLHKVQVPVLRGQRIYNLSPSNDPATTDKVVHNGQTYDMRCDLNIGPEWPTANLADVAHLDRMLGYKGNYMIFAMRESNDLTDAMMTPYVDNVLGVRDPDDTGNWTLDDFADYVRLLRDSLSEEDFAALEEDLRAEAERLLTLPRNDSEEIIVPSESLFIEALVGSHPILEKFKLQHRAVDVKKALAEVRSAELTNVRLAARLVAGEREDPDIDRKIIIEGDSSVVVPEA